MRCGKTTNLHFDHKDPKKKKFRISDKIDAPEDILMAEVQKCRLLCAKCHRAKTLENGEHGQPTSRHGTLWMYKKYKCRCPECKSAMSEYNKNKRVQTLQEIVASLNFNLKKAQQTWYRGGPSPDMNLSDRNK
ncbi:MAG: hypothetical protein Q8P20_00255 [bacterium]|nr:hypothetical protein [bacterium]